MKCWKCHQDTMEEVSEDSFKCICGATTGIKSDVPISSKKLSDNIHENKDKTDEKLLGNDLFGNIVKQQNKTSTLGDKFIVPPFSVLSARNGDWQNRKRQWLQLGIQSEIGRGEAITRGINPDGQGTGDNNDKAYTDNAKDKSQVNGLTFRATGFMADIIEERGGGTSIFDPTLCELMYSWFCPQNGQIVDPFAGGSVRGIVAATMGYKYWGCDLSERQIG